MDPPHEILAQMHLDYVQYQLKDLPDYLAQRRQALPFVPLGLTPEGYATGTYLHYSMPRMPYPPMPSLPQWYGGMPELVSVHAVSIPSAHGAMQVLPPPAQKDVVAPAAPVVLPQHPDTPPPTPPMRHPLPPRPQAPFSVGSITDAYLRMAAAKRRHMG